MADNAMADGWVGLDEGLRVRHIATFPLVSCQKNEGFREILRRPELEDFDQITITEGERIVGILERSSPPRGEIFAARDEVLAFLKAD